MGHTVKLSLYDVASDHYTAISSPVDTSATGYTLVSKDVMTTITDPMGDEHVVESMVVWVKGTSLADLRTKLAAIYDFCDQVRRFEAGNNTMFGRIYVQPGGSGTAFLSRIYDIEARVDASVLEHDWANWSTNVTFIYERDGFWEDAAIRWIVNPADSTNYFDLVNSADGVHYINLATTVIDGDVPSPLMPVLENTYNVAAGVVRVYAGGVACSSASLLPQLTLEAEAGVGGTPAVDAACSYLGSGSNTKVALSAGTTEAEMIHWTLTNTQNYGGMWYKALARWAANTNLGSVKLRWRLVAEGVVIWQGQQFLLENSTSLLQEMGEIKLPPIKGWLGNNLVLSLTGVSTTGSAVTITLDFIALMASGLARKMVSAATIALEYESTLYLRVANIIAYQPSYNNHLGLWDVMWNKELLAYPGMYQRVMFFLESESGGMEIARTFTVSIANRPRWRSVGE